MNEPCDRVYLDHNATAPLRPEARRAMSEALDAAAGNPASLHGEGRRAREMIDAARIEIARLVGAAPGEVVLTSGGSEALAAAVRGVCDRAPPGVRRLVVAAIEHSAVLETARRQAARGFELVLAPCDAQGRVDAAGLVARLEPGTALVALQWANNETGVVQPVEEVGLACRRAGVPFLVDAVQAAGKLAVDARAAHADLLAISAHKLGGPQGAGALVVRHGIVLEPLIPGGAQEKRRRAGTPGVAAIAGFGAAAAAAHASLGTLAPRLLRSRAKLETRLRDRFPEVHVNGEGAPRLSNTVNFTIPGVPGETLAIALDLAGFAVSTGSACAAGAVEPSHVLRAMGRSEEEARGAVRVSLGWSTTEREIDRFLDVLPRLVDRVRTSLAENR